MKAEFGFFLNFWYYLSMNLQIIFLNILKTFFNLSKLVCFKGIKEQQKKQQNLDLHKLKKKTNMHSSITIFKFDKYFEISN